MPAGALEPREVIVVSNKNMPDSVRVAEHYLVLRDVPKENHVALDLPTGEDIARADFQKQLVRPLRKALLLPRVNLFIADLTPCPNQRKRAAAVRNGRLRLLRL